MNEIIFNEPLKYKQLSELMNEEPAQGGRNRTLQLNRWKQYYEIEKIDNNKYIIKREYGDLEKKIIEKNGKFTTYIQNLIVYKLINENKQNNYEVRFSYRELLEFLCLVNPMFYQLKRQNDENAIDIQEYAESVIDRITISDKKRESVYDNIDLFLDYTETLLKRLVKDSLKSMEQRKLIISSKSFRLYRRRYNKELKRFEVQKHDCTDEEVSKILKFYVEVMQIFHIKKENQIFGMEDMLVNEFFAQINDRIKEEFDYDLHSPTFKLILAKGVFNTFQYEPSLSTKKLNENVQNKLKNNKYMRDNLPLNQRDIFIDDLISI